MIYKHLAMAVPPDRTLEEQAIEALNEDDFDTIKSLLQTGLNPNADLGAGSTLLHLACEWNEPAFVRYLLENGADIHRKNEDGETPLTHTINRVYEGVIRPFEDVSELVNILSQAGASPADHDGDHRMIGKYIYTLSFYYPEKATEWARRYVQDNWKKTSPAHVHAAVDGVLRQPTPAACQTALSQLFFKPDIHPERKDWIKHLAQLNGWNGQVDTGQNWARKLTDSEEWRQAEYPPMKVAALLNLIARIQTGDTTADEMGVSHDRALAYIKDEIVNQTQIYYSAYHQNVLAYTDASEDIKQALMTAEANHWCNLINALPPGKEFSAAIGWPGHAVYVGFNKAEDGTVSRRIDNLGGGCKEMHPADGSGRYYPHWAVFSSPEADVAAYVKELLLVSRGKVASFLPAIYHWQDLKAAPFPNPGTTAQKPQLTGNCVVKNNNAGQRSRSESRAFFQFMKQEERRFVTENAHFSPEETAIRESEKDLLALKYIRDVDAETPNNAVFRDNLKRFINKRATDKDHLSWAASRTQALIRDDCHPAESKTQSATIELSDLIAELKQRPGLDAPTRQLIDRLD